MGLFDGFRVSILRASCADLPPEKVVNTVIEGISSRPDAVQLTDALMVRLANRNPVPISMYGRQVVDTLPGADAHQRLSYEIQPFAHMSQGAGSVIIAQDAAAEEYVLLGKRTDGTGWGLPCGYSSVAPSLNAQGVYSEDIGHKRDDFERALVTKGTRVANERVADEIINKLVNARPAYDQSPVDTAIRETREEAGLDLRPEQLQFVYCATSDRSGAAQPHQNQTHYYLADLRAQKTLLPLKGTDDLDEPQWIKLSELKGAGKAMQLRGMKVVEGEAIEKSVAKMHENEYAAFGVTKEAIAKFSPRPAPESAISDDAASWHKHALSIAASMQKTLEKMQRDNPAPSCSVSP